MALLQNPQWIQARENAEIRWIRNATIFNQPNIYPQISFSYFNPILILILDAYSGMKQKNAKKLQKQDIK